MRYLTMGDGGDLDYSDCILLAGLPGVGRGKAHTRSLRNDVQSWPRWSPEVNPLSGHLDVTVAHRQARV